MSEGKRWDLWDRESFLTSCLINSQRKKSSQIDPGRLNPFAKKRRGQPRDSISDPALLAAMCGVKVPEPGSKTPAK